MDWKNEKQMERRLHGFVHTCMGELMIGRSGMCRWLTNRASNPHCSQFQTERDGVLRFLNKLTDRTDTCESSTCAQELLDDLSSHRERVAPSLRSKCSQLESLSHQVYDSRVTLRTELVAAQCHALAADMTDRAGHLMKLKEQHVQIEKEQDDRKRQERRRE